MVTTPADVRSATPAGTTALAGCNRRALKIEAAHPFLTGIHEPMAGEVTLEDLPVTGAIPEEMTGRYVRIGPNPVSPDPRGYHWFSGDSLLHGLAIEGGAMDVVRHVVVSPEARVLRETPIAVEHGPSIPTARSRPSVS